MENLKQNTKYKNKRLKTINEENDSNITNKLNKSKESPLGLVTEAPQPGSWLIPRVENGGQKLPKEQTRKDFCFVLAKNKNRA